MTIDYAAVFAGPHCKNIRIAGLHFQQHEALDGIDGLIAIVAHKVVEDLQAIRIGVGLRINRHIGELCRCIVIHRQDTDGLVIGNDVIFNIICTTDYFF